MYYILVLGNRAVGGINPKIPADHINNYKKELKKLYGQYQKVQKTR